MEYDLKPVEPLSFFRRDYLAPENAQIIKQESARYRLLNVFERFRLWRYVFTLQRELRKAGYNDLVIRREKLWVAYNRLCDDHRSSTDEAHKRKLRRMIRECARQGNSVQERIRSMREHHERYTHYRGWLEYEAAHRSELKQDQRREKQIRKQMRMESRWLESLLLDVFRKTNGCHYLVTEKGKERNRIPKFERAQITPDAHYFWLAASKRTLFGYRWLLPYSVNISALTREETISNMRAATKREVTALWSQQGQLIFRVSRLDSPDALPSLVKWRDTRPYYPEDQRHKLPYTIGVSENRKFRWLDFASEPHILIAGKSQSGKSNLVNGIIATNLSTHSPDELRIVLIDQKGGIEFTHWAEVPHLLWNVAKTVEDVKPVLDRVVSLMRRRMALLERARAKDLATYNTRTDDKLPRILVVIDEMNTFVGLGQVTEDIHNLLMLLVSQGRAVGVHVICCTQHPEVKVIPGRIKTNMAVRLSGAMPSVVASQIVLDTPDAANLPNMPGRFVAVSGLKTWVVQVPRIDDSDIAHVVGKAKDQYPLTSPDLPELINTPRLKVWDSEAVIDAALDYCDGALSGQRLNRLLGSESPGERYLNTQCKRIVDAALADGGIVDHRDQSYRLMKVNRGYKLTAIELGESLSSGDTDEFDAPMLPEAVSEMMSDADLREESNEAV